MKDDYNAFISECEIGGGEGKLAGMKVGVKDNISTKGVETTCGSRVLEGYVPPYDATAVERLKEEGAEIVGKTNMDEFGMGTTTETSAYGPTKNPADPDYVPGGSSGGSAAAVAAGLVDVALGTDTGGSIRCPASFCGIVGIKPTYGLVSRYGLIAYANSLETIGPMGRTVEDVARLLEVIAGKDPNDSTSRGEPENYVEHLEEGGGIDGLEVGIPEQLISEGVDEDVLEEFWDAIGRLEDEGASYHKVPMDSLEYALAAYYVIAMGEASSNLARYDGVRYGPPGDSSENWNESFAEARAR
ncbi:MAG: amidase family protein, partial [Halobacteria archaeon]|nr:amidase family protein [Halobacteria archaeon]